MPECNATTFIFFQSCLYTRWSNFEKLLCDKTAKKRRRRRRKKTLYIKHTRGIYFKFLLLNTSPRLWNLSFFDRSYYLLSTMISTDISYFKTCSCSHFCSPCSPTLLKARLFSFHVKWLPQNSTYLLQLFNEKKKMLSLIMFALLSADTTLR